MPLNIKELYWAAGFLEGEGNFHFSKAKHLSVQCAQVQKEPLDKLQKMFGGSLYLRQHDNPKWNDAHIWHAVGNRAASICMTLYELMSTKRREQIKKALAQWKLKFNVKYSQKCKKGHLLLGDNLYLYKGIRYCRTCRSYQEQIRRGWRVPEWKNRHPGEKQNFQCKRGHLYTEDNIYLWHNKRYCKQCKAIQVNNWREKQGETQCGNVWF